MVGSTAAVTPVYVPHIMTDVFRDFRNTDFLKSCNYVILRIFKDICMSWVNLEPWDSGKNLVKVPKIPTWQKKCICVFRCVWVCVTRWFWELECGYKDEYTSVQQHRCPLRSCLQQHSPPDGRCGNAGRRRCCEFIHSFVRNKHVHLFMYSRILYTSTNTHD